MRFVTGVDILEIARLEKSLLKPGFSVRFFGADELLQYNARGAKASFLAANFCAKEAFSKALGTGFRGFSLRDVQVLRDDCGRPYFYLSGKAEQAAKNSGLSFEVSLSHTHQYAVAFVAAFAD